MSFLTKEITVGRKAAKIMLVTGIVMLAAGVGIIIYIMSAAKGEENSLIFDRTVTARITDCRVTEHTRSSKKRNASGYHTTVTDREYVIDLLVTVGEGTYEDSQSVPKDVYDKYNAMEKNADMEWNLYRNPDGEAFLSLEDMAGAQAEYYGTGYITGNMGVKMIVGMVTAFIGWGVLIGGAKSVKKA